MTNPFEKLAKKGEIYIISSAAFMNMMKWDIEKLANRMTNVCSSIINSSYTYYTAIDAIKKNQVLLAVTYATNEPIGFIIFKVNKQCLQSPKQLRILEVSLVCTDQSFIELSNRKAIGTTLFGWFIYEVKKSKMFDLIILEVANPNTKWGAKYGVTKLINQKAYDFYRKFGFVENPSIHKTWKCFNQMYAYPTMELYLNKVNLKQLKKLNASF